MNCLELINAVKLYIFIIIVLIIFQKPLVQLLSQLIRFRVQRKKTQIDAEFAKKHDSHPRPERLRSLMALIDSTGADVEKLAIECLLQEYVSNNKYWPEKLAIGDLVMSYFVHKPKAIILDTGTSAAAVAVQMMARSDWPDLVITNSLTSAAFISVTKSIHARSVPKVYMPPGIVHAEYRGSYLLRSDLNMNDSEYNRVLEVVLSIPRHIIKGEGRIYGIVAATYFSSSYGPGANSEWNRQWKRDTFKLADTVFICVDVTKIGQHCSGVFSEKEWLSFLESKEVRVLIAGTPNKIQRANMTTEVDKLVEIENRISKTILYHGEVKDSVWEFRSRDGTKCLSWGARYMDSETEVLVDSDD